MPDNGAPDQAGYRVQLEIYEGPLDLLLRLIERDEMDITQVSLARVTDQYLAYLGALQQARVDDLAEFLVIAAKLILIKSRVLLPRPDALGEQEEDVGEDLVERLKEYRRFKQVAGLLREREEQGLRSYARLVPAARPEAALPPGGGDAALLMEAMLQILRERREKPVVDRVMPPLRVTISEKIAHIDALLAERSRIVFRDLLRACASRLEIVVSFLAMLEMIKQVRVRVEQDGLFGEITIVPVSPGEAEPAPAEENHEPL